MNGVLIFLSITMATFSASLLPPMLVSATLGEIFVWDYAVIFGLLLFISGGIYLAVHGRPLNIGRVGSYTLLLAVWVILPAAASLPFLLIGHLPAIDALFEAVSGLTTTGASVLASVDELPRSLMLWRSLIQWLGGFLTLLSVLLVLAPAGIGGLPDRHIKLIEHAGRGSEVRIAHTIGGIALAYTLTSLACLMLLIISGIPLMDAVCLTFSTVSTGGFMPRDGTLSVYASQPVKLTLSLFMILGGTSILWQRMMLQRRTQLLATHRESYYVVAVALIAGLLVALAAALNRATDSAATLGDILVSGLTTGISLVTTTGFQTDAAPFAVLPFTLVLFIAFVGAGAFSTAGGIKMYRVGGMLVQTSRDLRRLVYPHGIRPAHFGSQPYDMQLMKAIWSLFCAALLAVAVGAVYLSRDLPQFSGAWLASVSALANIGPLYGPQWGAQEAAVWPAYASFSSGSKWCLMSLMVLGRLEILALLGLLNLRYWASR